ncbi:MAG: RNA polymerase sigma factor [Actinomycetota bacterium]
MAVTRRELGATERARAAARLPPDVPAPAGGGEIVRSGRPSTIPPFQSFLEQHRSIVYRFLLGAVGAAEVDDCFQETFLSALRAYPKLRNGDNLRGWILAIATRKAIDAARARGRRPEPIADMAELLAEQASRAYLAVEIEGDQLIDEPLWSDILSLPPRQRVALVHRVLLDRPYAELAAAMGCSVDAARANVYQALKKLKEAWTSRE